MKRDILQSHLHSEQGAALLTVLVALLLISLMTLELQYTSLIERKLAYNDLNKIQTHYLAKSGVRLGLLRLTAFGKITKSQAVPGGAGVPFAMIKPYLPLIWSIPFPAYPPERGSLEKLSIQEKAEQLEALKDTRITNGQFTYSISSESSKLNLNLLVDAGTGFRTLPPTATPAKTALGGFIGFILYEKISQIFKDSENPVDEFGNVKPEEIIENIMDWTSPTQGQSVRDNESWYEKQNPPYKTKRGRFFTLDEVKLVKDMSPSLFLKLKPHITVFSEEGRVNLNEATQSGKLKLYFPRITDYTVEQLNKIFATNSANGGTGWGSVDDFFRQLESFDSVSAREYDPNVRSQFFTVESALFVIRSKGAIQKSGSTIESNLTVGVAFDPARYRVPFPKYNSESECENKPKFDRGVWLGGKCVYPPFDEQECLDEGLQTCINSDSKKAGCFALRDGGMNTGNGQTTCFIFPERKKDSDPPLWGGIKIYSWLES